MTKIGRNIKKIRGIKKLSQSEFAQIFNLKRASIGAYEEGRAEPKLTTVIEIANHFSIAIDDLLLKDLSVNNLYQFDIFKNDLVKNSATNLRPSHFPLEIVQIPYVDLSSQLAYLSDETHADNLISISLPLPKGKRYLAFELETNEMLFDNNGIGKGDILVCTPSQKQNVLELEIGKLYLFEFRDSIIFRRLVSKNSKIIRLAADHPTVYEIQRNVKEIQKIWEIRVGITNNISGDSMSNRIASLYTEVQRLKAKISEK